MSDTPLTLEALRAELAPIRSQLAAMEPLAAGVQVLGRAIEALRHDARQIKAAVNDLAKLQMTSGEAEALHDDVNKAATKQDELEARLSVVERIVRELRDTP